MANRKAGVRGVFEAAVKAIGHRGYVAALGSSYLVMAAAMVAQLVFVPIYLDRFGQYQFGVLMVLLSLVNFAVIGIAWLSGGALRLLGEFAGAGDDAGFRRAFGLIKALYVGYGLVLAAGLVLVALGLAPAVFSGGSAQDVDAGRQALLLTAAYLPIFYAAGVDRLALTARKRQGAGNMAQLAGIIAFTAATAAWLWQGGGMAGVMGLQIAGALVSMVVSRSMLRRELPDLRLRMPRRTDADLLARLGGRTGAGFFLHGALVLALLADTALVGLLGGARAAAEFFLVWKIAEVLVQLIWRLPEALSPYLLHMDVRGDHATLDRIARQGYALVAGVSLLAGVGYALLGPELVALWVGAARVPDAGYAFILAGGAIFWLGTARLPVVLASARVALRGLNRAGVIELLGKIAITLLLFPRFGYLAVLAAINLVHFLGVAFLYFSLLREVSPAGTGQSPREKP